MSCGAHGSAPKDLLLRLAGASPVRDQLAVSAFSILVAMLSPLRKGRDRVRAGLVSITGCV